VIASGANGGATRIGGALREAIVALATILVLIGASILPFLNPVWIGFEQGRADVVAWTGWSESQVAEVTNAVLHDLIVGPPDFAMAVDGVPVFDARERGHMQDVRNVFALVGAAVVGGLAVLVVAAAGARRRAWFWRSVAIGAGVLAVSVVFLGFYFALAFDSAFELFHRLFFPSGSYDFDPATERLVQLLPEAFWYETVIAFGIVVVALSIGVAWYALRRVARLADGATKRAGPGAPSTPPAVIPS
jgi:integral membrane protein (TIGR01906 family)